MCTFLRLQSAEDIAKCKSFVRPCPAGHPCLGGAAELQHERESTKRNPLVGWPSHSITPFLRGLLCFLWSESRAVGIYAHICVFLVFAVAIG